MKMVRFIWKFRWKFTGVAESLNALGTLYAEGIGVDKDMFKAVDFFERAAALGFAGNIGENGRNWTSKELRTRWDIYIGWEKV